MSLVKKLFWKQRAGSFPSFTTWFLLFPLFPSPPPPFFFLLFECINSSYKLICNLDFCNLLNKESIPSGTNILCEKSPYPLVFSTQQHPLFLLQPSWATGSLPTTCNCNWALIVELVHYLINVSLISLNPSFSAECLYILINTLLLEFDPPRPLCWFQLEVYLPFQWCILLEIFRLMSVSDSKFNQKFQVFVIESWNRDRNQSQQTEKAAKNSHNIQGSTATLSNTMKAIISNNDVPKKRCIFILWF